MYIITMKYNWNSGKNKWLKETRNISFEKVIFHLSRGDVWSTADHPDQKKYPNQRIYFVNINNYIYMVPYVTHKNEIFLKTIIPSRKATRMYKKEQKNNEE